MSVYTAGEIVVWLSLAALLGGVLGWLLRSLTVDRIPDLGRDPRPGPVAEIRHDVVAVEPGPYPHSAKPGTDGGAPGPEWTIKATTSSMIYRTPESSSYDRTVAKVWFRTEADAVAAGFRPPKR